MKKPFQLSILLLVALSAGAQQPASREQQEYIEKVRKNYIPFKPVEKEKLLAFHSFAITISDIANYTPFTAAYEWSPSQQNALHPTSSRKLLVTSDSGIPDYAIIKQEENEQLKAVFYTSIEYDEMDEAGIWIAVCYKNENTWHKYYTGLTSNTPLHFKWGSKYPLIKNDSTIQLEASIIQRLEEVSQPIMMGKFQLVKDGLLVAFDLTKIKLDSDGDGLTDIVENKLMLDPFDPDTNHNGIPDNIDASPRSTMSRSDKTTVYESLIAEILAPATSGIKDIVNITGRQEKWTSDSLLLARNIRQQVANNARTVMIISDDTAILGIKNSNRRVIVLSGKEYELYKGKNVNSPERYFLSPLFKVDDVPDTYMLSVNIGPASYEYRVEKINNKWFFLVVRYMIA